MSPGDRLPTESALAARFDVSRTVVREAARLLVQRGLVSVRPGRGMTVSEFDGSMIADQLDLLITASGGTFEQLLELRLALEVEMAALAAARADPTDVGRLCDTIAQGRAALSDRDDFLESDLAFHRVLAEASANPFFVLVARPVDDVLRRGYRFGQGYPAAERDTLTEHRRIAKAVGAGDVAAARTATARHLRRIARDAAALTATPPRPTRRRTTGRP